MNPTTSEGTPVASNKPDWFRTITISPKETRLIPNKSHCLKRICRATNEPEWDRTKSIEPELSQSDPNESD